MFFRDRMLAQHEQGSGAHVERGKEGQGWKRELNSAWLVTLANIRSLGDDEPWLNMHQPVPSLPPLSLVCSSDTMTPVNHGQII